LAGQLLVFGADFWNMQAKLSNQHGKHYFKVGGELRSYRGNSSLPNPYFHFRQQHGDTYVTEHALERSDGDVPLGAIGSDSRARTPPTLRAQNHFWASTFRTISKSAPTSR